MSNRMIAIYLMTFGMLSACGSSPSEADIQTAIAQTQTAAGAATHVSTLPEPTATRTPAAIPSKGIDWDEAKSWVGEFKVVCGPVVDTAYANGSSGKPTFLNLGRSYPDPERFTVVIWDDNRANFPAQPENYYLGKDICVDGLIELYKGGAQIEGTTQDQIDIQ